jgi:hypothetical protein
MDGVFLDESKNLSLTDMLANAPWAGCKMGLSQYTFTIDHATPGSSLTSAEIAFTGYARQVLSGWSTPTLDSLFRAVSFAAPVTFANSGTVSSSSISSWFFIDETSGDVLIAGNFSTPFVILASDSFTTVPFIRETGA